MVVAPCYKLLSLFTLLTILTWFTLWTLLTLLTLLTLTCLEWAGERRAKCVTGVDWIPFRLL